MKIDNSLSSFETADACFLGVPLATSKTPNPLSSKAPDLLRFAINNKDDYDARKKLSVFDVLKIADLGNVSLRRLESVVESATSQKLFILGGEHFITGIAVDALIRKGEKFDLVVFDAHLDVRRKEDGFEPNACFLQKIVEKMPKGSVHLFGQRAFSQDEYEYAKSKGLAINDYGKIRGKKIYISFDIDALDSIYVPTCSTPEPFGIELKMADRMLSQLFSDNNVLGIDFVEFSGKTFDVTYSNVATLIMNCLKNLLK